jgi:hypothetical protein
VEFSSFFFKISIKRRLLGENQSSSSGKRARARPPHLDPIRGATLNMCEKFRRTIPVGDNWLRLSFLLEAGAITVLEVVF